MKDYRVSAVRENLNGELPPWMEIAKDACQHVLLASADASHADKLPACERAAIQTSLQNLRTFLWIDEAVKQQCLQLHSWYFDIAQGQLIYNHTFMSFELAQAN